jgi:hypothetical protein
MCPAVAAGSPPDRSAAQVAGAGQRQRLQGAARTDVSHRDDRLWYASSWRHIAEEPWP